jgi:hypothetical protein
MKKGMLVVGYWLLVMLMGVSMMPVVAAPLAPSIKVNAVWRPATQLTTIDADSDGQTDSGDDLRYVVADIYATTTVEFWAVGLVCTVNKAALESYIPGNDPVGTEDNVAMLSAGGDWFINGTAQLAFKDTTDSDGKFSFGITRSGASSSVMGVNGVSTTLLLATLKYRVKEGLTVASNSTFPCTTSFLNRDGKVVVAAAYTAPPALKILPGYTLSGKVTYQSLAILPTPTQAIGVACENDGDGLFDDVVTTADIRSGMFSVSNLRQQGRYDCRFTGNIFTPGAGYDLHLMTQTEFNLTTSSYALLPSVLPTGNISANSSPDYISNDDFSLVTSNWLHVDTQPFQFGDVNGDKKTDQTDLALVGGNFNSVEPYPSHHFIYSLPRDYETFQNSHLWVGGYREGAVTRFLAGNTRDYWPAVSPDGSKIAFIRNVGTGLTEKFALFTAPIANGVVGTATRVTPANATYDAFAPSWSPEGTRLAFVCSYNRQWVDISNPAGSLCLAEGSNIQTLQGSIGGAPRPVSAKIYPPTWADAKTVLFGFAPIFGVTHNCDQRVCRYDIDAKLLFNTAYPVGSDMPVVRRSPLGVIALYRFDEGAGDHTLRVAQINTFDWNPSGAYPSTTAGSIHTEVTTFGAPFITFLDYYAVSESNADPDIILYSDDPATEASGGDFFFILNFIGNATTANWDPGSGFRIGGAVTNPGWASGYNAALRNTVAFLP